MSAPNGSERGIGSDLPFDVPDSMKRRYLERRRGDVGVLREAVRLGYHENVVRIGHQMKGNAGTFGFPELEDIGERLETAGLEEDTLRAAVLIDEFELCLEDAFESP